jgi:6-phosphogluconolactonase
MKLRAFLVFIVLSLTICLGVEATQAAEPVGAVYTMSNTAQGNSVLIFKRRSNGTLDPAGVVATGGLGTGGGLGNQSAVVLDQSDRWLFVVNAGSHEISSFAVHATGLQHIETIASGGFRPISLALHDHLLYVLHAGGNIGEVDNITGFRVQPNGTLMPLSDSTRPLSEAVTDPAQIAFTPDGSVLVVTEKSTNRLVTYTVGRNGRPGDLAIHNSAGTTPFGFAFGKRSQLFISEAFGGAPNASAMSSYTISHQGDLQVISPSVGTTQTAACWVVVTNDGRFAYVTNTGSGSISSYQISFDGGLTLLNALAAETGPGSGPIDVDLTNDGRFLYALSSAGEKIDAFRVQAQGGLTPLPGVSVPTGSNGLAAR